MAADEKWYFTKEKLATTPSRRCGFDADKELSYRQQAANFIQDMGQRLVVSQLCINTAIVYMHRFYVFHSLSQFHRNAIAAAALFLAAKVEEQPRKLEHVIRVAHNCLHKDQQGFDIKSEQYLEQAQDLVFNENVLLQTLGFDVAIDHPHTHVVRCCHLVKASKDLAQTSYFMASNSLHLTTMCLQYKPTVVACFCIHLACKWSNWEIPQSNEGKQWFWYVDRSVTSELLQQLTAEFLHIFDRCPSRLKRKIMSISANQSPSMSHPSLPSALFDSEPRKIQSPASGMDAGPTFQSNRSHHSTDKSEDKKTPASASGRPPVDYREYREKKERERLDREKAAAGGSQTHGVDPNKHHHSHHHKPAPGMSIPPGKHSGPMPLAALPQSSSQKSHAHHNHHHRLDPKTGQQLPPPRHAGSGTVAATGSTSGQIRDQANRQRTGREYNSSGGSAVYPHGHAAAPPRPKDSNQPDASSVVDPSVNNRQEANVSSEPSSRTSSQEKLTGGSNHNAHRTSGVQESSGHRLPDGKHQPNDKRQYDPVRHKPPEHRKEEQKLYNKYAADPARLDRRGKPDILEQRSEEVRKLIEKPLPTPKPRQELQKEEYIANMMKQSHHSKYNQEKLQSNPVVVLNQMKFVGNKSQMKSPDLVLSEPWVPNSSTANALKPGKSVTPTAQYSAHGVSQILKDATTTVKNGNSQSTGSLVTPEESKPETPQVKRPRGDDLPQQISHQTPPVVKHRSLFSPEKITQPHSQRPKPRQRTPPSASKVPRQEQQQQLRPIDSSVGVNLSSSLAGSPQPEIPSKRVANESSSQRRHRTSSSGEPEPPAKPREEEVTPGLDAMRMLGRVPELIQPIRDTLVSVNNGKSTSVANDLRPPELIKPFEPEPVGSNQSNRGIQSGAASQNSRQSLPNGYDAQRGVTGITQEVGTATPSGRYPIEADAAAAVRYSSPTKTAETISALLQETPAPMPSLIQPDQTTSGNADVGQAPVVAATPVPVTSVAPVADEKRSEHRKSDKKKKKDKHKDRDKEKDREQSKEKRKGSKEEKKHKRKHKEKDKERDKHRDRGVKGDEASATGQTPGAAVGGSTTGPSSMTGPAIPIKITIPKDKINLGNTSEATTVQGGQIQPGAAITDRSKSPQGSGLKIKIPKERLKGTTESVGGGTNQPTAVEPVAQPPLKIKIRTDAISRSGESFMGEARKRERDADLGASPNTPSGAPPNKKHVLQASSYGVQRSVDRPNGRHYSSSGNNKDKHSSSYYKTSSKSTSQHPHPT